MGPRCSSAETQVCHRSYIIAARHKIQDEDKKKHKKHTKKTTKQPNKVYLIKSGIISCLINKTLEKTEGAMMNGQSRDAVSIWHNNPETLAAFDTTIQRRWQHLAQQSRDAGSIWHKTRRQTEQETQHRKQIHSSIVYFMEVFSVLWTSVIL